jgi:hypothetical protein
MKMKNILILSLMALVTFTMTSCFEENEMSGPIVDPQLNLMVLDVDGNPVSGATVDLFANRDDYRKFNSKLASAPTDAGGTAIFTKSDMVTSGNFYYSVKVGDDRNWDGATSKALTVSNGVSMIETTVDAVTIGTAISGPMQVISSTGESFSINDFPGKYEWSVIAGGSNATIDDPTNNNTNISFTVSETDYPATIQVVATPDGFPTTTMTYDITVLAFCEYDQNNIAGDLVGEDATNWVLGAYPSVVNVVGTAGSLTITGLGNGWMEDYWGEEIQNTVYVNMKVSDDGLFITIPLQSYFTTIWDGDPYDYDIEGSGSINGCSGAVTINYDMIQEGFSTGGWSNGAGGSTNGSDFWQAKVSFTP